MRRWREAMAAALYGPDGFYVRAGNRPAAHFRTSAQIGAGFAAALGRLLERVDAALGHPDPLDLVDVGAGGGELLDSLTDAVPPALARRLRPVAVEVAPAPDGAGAGPVTWRRSMPPEVTGLVLATEWLDNVPVDVAEVDPDGVVRYVLVDPATGREALGPEVTGEDAEWLARWWPLTVPGTRAEIGAPRDRAWARVVGAVRRGVALAVDYGHVAGDRPPFGTLTGYRHGREVPPVPDGTCDLTAHVAMDAVAAAGGGDAVHLTQAEALRALGVHGRRPPLALAYRDPAGYLRRLAAASLAAELTDPAGLGGHRWLVQPVGMSCPPTWLVAR
ncbi:MAG: SAM-dependent methyltransferase [Micromonosporaceae bacterium]